MHVLFNLVKKYISHPDMLFAETAKGIYRIIHRKAPSIIISRNILKI
jgi:hypothetical protein